MDVAELLYELCVVADVEVVVALLPEMFGVADQASRHSLLQGLYGIRKCAALRLA